MTARLGTVTPFVVPTKDARKQSVITKVGRYAVAVLSLFVFIMSAIGYLTGSY